MAGQIRQFESTKAAEGLHPTDVGVDAWQQEGRRVGQAYHQMGEDFSKDATLITTQIDNHDTMADISKGSSDQMALMDNLSQNWNQTINAADPNDAQKVAEKWRTDVLQPALEKFGTGFSTQRSQMWGLEQTNKLRQHFFEKTAGDVSTKAGDALVVNMQGVQAHASNLARIEPGSIDAIHGLVDDSIDNLVKNTPGLSAADGSRAKTELELGVHKEVAKSAVIGAASQNPDAAEKLLNSPSVTNYLDGTDVKALGSYINEQQRASMAAQREQNEQQLKQQRQDVETAQNKIVGQTMDPDTGAIKLYPGIFRDIATLSMMPNAGDIPKAMQDWAYSLQERQAKGTPAVTDPHVYADFLARANLPPSDPHALTLQQIYNASAAGILSDKDFGRFRGWVAEQGRNPQRIANQKVLNQFFVGMKKSITKSNMLTNDADGDERNLEFQQTMQERFDSGVASGKSPLDLVSPGSKDYIAKDIGRFQIPQQQSLDRMTQRATGNVAPLPPVSGTKYQKGMSMDDLAKQVGGK